MLTDAVASGIRIPTIAIHGVGHHELGRLENTLNETIGNDSALQVAISEFNWDQYADHGRWGSLDDSFRSLRYIAATFHATAKAVLSTSARGPNALLASLQLWLCRAAMQLIAVSLAALVAVPAIVIIVLLPPALHQIGPVFPMDKLMWIVGWSEYLVGYLLLFMLLVILILGLVRTMLRLSWAPIKSSVTCVFITCFTPLLLILSVPLAVNWMLVGMMVLFVCLMGLFAVVLEAILPSDAASVWKNPAIAPYLVAIVAGMLGMQLARSVIGYLWYHGPLKILLDIFRYVGDPAYRSRVLDRLDSLVRNRWIETDRLVIVSHSQGSTIALDYLRNWSATNPDCSVWLITLGSPYRQFFLAWLPEVFFETSTARTVLAISEKFHSFRWLNVYRPLDYIGRSLGLGEHAAGLDWSTGQWCRLNGHANYWNDRVVLQSIEHALPHVHEPGMNPQGSHERKIPVASDLKPTPSVRHQSFALGLGLVVLSIGWLISSLVDRNAELARLRAAIDAHGERRQVLVSHRRIADVAGDQMYADEFRFIADGLDMPPYQVSPYLPESTAQQRFDYQALEAFVRQNCQLEHQPTGLEDANSIACTSSESIELAYLPSEASHPFYLPAFEAKLRPWDVAGWLLYAAILYVFLFVPAAPFVLLTSSLYSIFLGGEPDGADMAMLE